VVAVENHHRNRRPRCFSLKHPRQNLHLILLIPRGSHITLARPPTVQLFLDILCRNLQPRPHPIQHRSNRRPVTFPKCRQPNHIPISIGRFRPYRQFLPQSLHNFRRNLAWQFPRRIHQNIRKWPQQFLPKRHIFIQLLPRIRPTQPRRQSILFQPRPDYLRIRFQVYQNRILPQCLPTARINQTRPPADNQLPFRILQLPGHHRLDLAKCLLPVLDINLPARMPMPNLLEEVLFNQRIRLNHLQPRHLAQFPGDGAFACTLGPGDYYFHTILSVILALLYLPSITAFSPQGNCLLCRQCSSPASRLRAKPYSTPLAVLYTVSPFSSHRS